MTEAAAGPARTATIAVLFTAFVAATYGFGVYLFPIAAAEMRHDLGIDYGTVGAITAGGQIGALAAAWISGLLAARLGSVPVILGAVLIGGGALAAMAMTGGPLGAGLLMLCLGACAAASWTPVVGVVRRSVAAHHRGKVLGLVSSGTSYGVLAGGLLAPWIIGCCGWRNLWLAAGLATVALAAAGAVVLWQLRLLGRSAATAPPKPAGQPVAEPRRRRRTALLWLMMLLNGFAFLPFQVYLSPYLRDGLGYTLSFAAQAWQLIGLVGMASGLALGAMADRLGVRRTLELAYLCTAAAALALAVAPLPGLVLAASVAFGIAFYAVFGLVPAYISKVFGAEEAVLVFGTGNVLVGMGAAAGNLAGGRWQAAAGSFAEIYLAVAGLALVLLACAAALPAERPADPPTAVGAPG